MADTSRADWSLCCWVSDMRVDQFWNNHIERDNGCWEWQKGKNDRGYGEVSINGISLYVHRFAWELLNGEIPGGMCILHKCDNPSCINPDHLFIGTQLDNVRDMLSKGRASPPPVHRGTKNNKAVLCEWKVRYIRASDLSQRAIARMFGIGKTTVAHVQCGRTWAWLP